jgi:hypothetical protein
MLALEHCSVNGAGSLAVDIWIFKDILEQIETYAYIFYMYICIYMCMQTLKT